MAGNGGRREGAGRPRKSEKYAGQVAALEDRIADRLPHLADLALELAEGVWAEKETPDGKTKVYREPPDLKALIYLVDRIAGRPTQALEHSGEDGGPIRIVVEYEDAPAPDHAAEAAPGPGGDPEGDAAL